MKIFCIGKNYSEHNKELDGVLYNTVEPVVFAKTENAMLKRGKPFFVPDWMGRIDHEVELVVRISRMGKNIAERFAHRYYDAATVGIDFTARELQAKLKAQGKPWELSKSFDGAACIGELVPKEELGDLMDQHFHLDINGVTVQQGHTADMTHSIDKLIAFISKYFMLTTGDILYTGTPAGVGPVHPGDHLDAFLGDRPLLSFNCK